MVRGASFKRVEFFEQGLFVFLFAIEFKYPDVRHAGEATLFAHGIGAVLCPPHSRMPLNGPGGACGTAHEPRCSRSQSAEPSGISSESAWRRWAGSWPTCSPDPSPAPHPAVRLLGAQSD